MEQVWPTKKRLRRLEQLIMSMEAMLQTLNSNVANTILIGTGSPEGVAFGSNLYWDTANQRLYVNPVRTSNTGWVLQ